MKKNMSRVAQWGFTLIELVVVIVVLAILAAFAIPRFADLAGQARESTVEGMRGTLIASANLAHSLQLAAAGAANAPVTMSGQSVTMANRYPTGNAAGITASLQDTTGFTVTYTTTPNVATFAATGAAGTCQTVYTQVATLGNAPAVTIDVSNC